MTTVQLLISTAEGGLATQVEDVVVHTEARNRAIGSRLLEQCQEWSLTRGALRMQLAADTGISKRKDSTFRTVGFVPG